MARPFKQEVSYFPHYCKCGRVITILENRWGNDGYAFFYKLFELLGDKDGHMIDCRKVGNWEYLLAKVRVGDELGEAILQKLADLEVIDATLWGHRIIWSDDFIDSIKDAYKRRFSLLPSKPSVSELLHTETPLNEVNDDMLHTETPVSEVDVDINPQIKRDIKRKREDIVEQSLDPTPPSREKIPYDEIVDYLNKAAGTSFMSSTKQTRSLISARWAEGFRLPEFKTVIDSKVKEWGHDPKMRGYLRPQTLFGTKFEGYFQNSPMKPKQTVGDDDLRPRQGENLADYYHRLKEAGRLDVYFEVVNGGEG